MILFVGFLALMGAGVDTFVIGDGVTFVPFASIAAIAVGSGQAWWSLRFGDRSVLASSAAVPLSDRLAQCLAP